MCAPTRARRLRTLSRIGTIFGVAALLAGGAPFAERAAAAGNDAWRALPPVPTLDVRFEPGSEEARCAPLRENPDSSVVACWTTEVDRAVSNRAGPLERQESLACVEAWNLRPAGNGCQEDSAGCIQPRVGFFERTPEALPIDANVLAVSRVTHRLAREYTAFQMLRSGHALNPHRDRIAGLAISQGMLALSLAHSLRSVGETLASQECATEHLDPYLALAEQVTAEVGGADLPAILEEFPQKGREWERNFREIQLAVLGSDQVRAGGRWQDLCDAAAEAEADVGRLDADVNVWCGYAFEQIDMPGVATRHWRLARRSPHHPEAAHFAAQRLALEIAGEGLPPVEVQP